MDISSLDIKESAAGITLKVKVQPRASRNSIAGIMGDCLKIQLTSPPVEGAANAACVEFISELLEIAKNRIVIISGEKNRNKLLRILGISKNEFINRITKFD